MKLSRIVWIIAALMFVLAPIIAYAQNFQIGPMPGETPSRCRIVCDRPHIDPIDVRPLLPRWEWQTRAVVVTEWHPWYGLTSRVVVVNVLVRVQ
jgi:hypothetical protein